MEDGFTIDELKRLVKESLYEMDDSEFDDELDSEVEYRDETDFEDSMLDDMDEVPLSAIDMPIQDKAVFNDQSYDDEFADLSGYQEFGDDYEGSYQDDVSVSPGYFNEGEDELDPIALAKTNAQSKYDSTKAAMDYAGDNWAFLSPQEKEEIIADMERDFERSLNENLELTEAELSQLIREGVEKLHRKSLIENRLEQINKELNALNNPEAWENARTEAKSQLKQKHIAWQEITTRGKIMSEAETPVKNRKNTSKDSVSEIMKQASKLMAEAKEKYNNISK